MLRIRVLSVTIHHGNTCNVVESFNVENSQRTLAGISECATIKRGFLCRSIKTHIR
jgi:hypothetical protein